MMTNNAGIEASYGRWGGGEGGADIILCNSNRLSTASTNGWCAPLP